MNKIINKLKKKKDMPDQQASVNKFPTERQWKCKNKMLEAINSYEHLSVNGAKDSQYNDLIAFEDSFENWDMKGIILTKWDWNRKYKEPYVYVTPIGIYTEIGIFARKLQRLLSDYHFGRISVINIGSDLHITCYPSKLISENEDRSVTFEAKFLHINQIEDGFSYDGWKFDLL